MISAAELAAMQATANASADVTFDLQRRTTGQGATGNVTTSYGHVANVSGSLAQPTAGQMQNYGYKIGSLAAWQVRLPVGTDVRETDHLVTPDGQTLEVQVILAPQSYQTAVRVLASEVR